MDAESKRTQLKRNRNRLAFWAVAGTIFYICWALIYAYPKGMVVIMRLSPNELGDFLAGVFAPLAFLWLVIGYRMQALELEQNSDSLMQQATEMKNAVEQATAQADAARKSAHWAAASNALELRRFIYKKLTILVSEILVVSDQTVDYLWDEFKDGDEDIFFKKFDCLYEIHNSGLRLKMEVALHDRLIQGKIQHFLKIYHFYVESVSDMPHGSLLVDDFASGPCGKVGRQLANFMHEFTRHFDSRD